MHVIAESVREKIDSHHQEAEQGATTNSLSATYQLPINYLSATYWDIE